MKCLSQARAPAVHNFLLGFLLCRSLLRELIFKLRHTDFLAAEFHAFHFQSKSLIQSAFTRDCDPPTGGHHAMPGKSMRLTQCAYDQPRTARNPRCASDCS